MKGADLAATELADEEAEFENDVLPGPRLAFLRRVPAGPEIIRGEQDDRERDVGVPLEFSMIVRPPLGCSWRRIGSRSSCRQRREERSDLGLGHLARMTFAAEHRETDAETGQPCRSAAPCV